MFKSNKIKTGFRGYCTHNKFGEYKIPVPALPKYNIQRLRFKK